MSSGLILKRPNLLSYPGTAPGFDPSHVASKGIVRFSGVAVGSGNFNNILSGKGPSASSGFSGQVTNLGPSAFSNSSSNSLTFSGQNTDSQRFGTVAAIATFSDSSSFRAVFAPNSTDTASGFTLFNNAGALMLRLGTVNATSAIPLVNNVPYFIAASADNVVGIIKYVALRLDTGQVFTDTQSGGAGASGAMDGSYLVGQWQGGGLGIIGNIAATMYANNFLSFPELIKWVQDPWSFWYPQKFDLLQAVGKAASGSAFTISAVEGVYTLTGKTQSLNVARTISTVQGTYTQTGEAQAFTRGKGLSVSQGNYILTGEAQTLNRGINIKPVQGAYSLTGETQGLGIGLPAAQGTYTLTGEPQKFPIALSSKEAQGSYGVTGFPQVLTNTKFGQTSTPQGGKFIADVGNMTERNY